MEEPKSVIEQLLTEPEMTEAKIADALKEMGVEVSQATINRIKNGKHKHTRFDIGFGLLQLRDQRTQHSA